MNSVKNISTITELQIALEQDEIKHSINKLATHLVVAINDWPTLNQINIDDFLEDIQSFFGGPIKQNLINRNQINLTKKGNAWRIEAISSINELLRLANSINLGDNLETVVKHIVNFYGKKSRKVVIDGNQFNSLSEFYQMLAKQLKTGNCPWGENLDSLDEIVSANFNYTKNESLDVKQIIWLNFTKSKRELSDKRGEEKVIDILEEIFTSNENIKLIKMPTA